MKYLFFLFLFCSFLDAHKVNLFITNENGNLDIYSYFANGKACKNCRLIIKNEDKIILDDKLDSLGQYLYSLEFNSIEVIVEAGEGHIAKEKLKVEDISKEDITVHKEKEEETNFLKMLFGFVAIFIIFFVLKRFKR